MWQEKTHQQKRRLWASVYCQKYLQTSRKSEMRYRDSFKNHHQCVLKEMFLILVCRDSMENTGVRMKLRGSKVRWRNHWEGAVYHFLRPSADISGGESQHEHPTSLTLKRLSWNHPAFILQLLLLFWRKSALWRDTLH